MSLDLEEKQHHIKSANRFRKAREKIEKIHRNQFFLKFPLFYIFIIYLN